MATVGEVAYSLKADVRQFTSGLASADKSLKTLEADIALATKHFQAGTLSITGYQTALASANKSLVAMKATGAATAAQTATLAPVLVRTGAASKSMMAGVGRLRETMTALTLTMIGAPGPIGRVASAMSVFAIGGPVTVAILAGLAAIGLAIERITRSTRIAKGQLEEIMGRTAGLKGPEQALFGHEKAQLEADLRALEGLKHFLGTGIVTPDDVKRLAEVDHNIGLIQRRLEEIKNARGFEHFGTSLDQMTKQLEIFKNLRDQLRSGGLAERALLPGVEANIANLEGIIATNLQKMKEFAGASIEAQKAIKAIEDAMTAGKIAEGLAETVRKAREMQTAMMLVVDIFEQWIDSIQRGNQGMGQFLGTLLGAVAGFFISGGQVGGAVTGAQIGGRLGSKFDNTNQSVSAAAVTPGAAVPSLSLSGMPPATNPLAATRDGDWIRFLSESLRVAGARGAA